MSTIWWLCTSEISPQSSAIKLLLLCAVLVTVCYRGGWAQCNLIGKIPAPDNTCCAENNTNCCSFNTAGPCFCNIYATNQSCFGFYPPTAADTSQCCGKLQSSNQSYVYTPTNNEKAGLCKRTPAMAWDTPQRDRPNPLPGPCACKKGATACFAPSPPQPLCPKPPATASGRMLGGTPLGDYCPAGNFRVGPTQVCSGVYGYISTTKTKEVLTTDICLQLMKGLVRIRSLNAYGVFGSPAFPITTTTNFTTVAKKLVSIELPTYIKPTCQAACLYNKATMSSIINFKTCYIVSCGYDQKLGTTGTAVINSGTCNLVNVTKETSCTGKPPLSGAQCFKASDTNVKGCWGDSGAPVFCHLSIANEAVVYGLVDLTGQPPNELTGATIPTNRCNTNNEFFVIPLS